MALALAAFAASACAQAQAATPTLVGIRIHYSRFQLDRIEVPANVPITFTIEDRQGRRTQVEVRAEVRALGR